MRYAGTTNPAYAMPEVDPVERFTREYDNARDGSVIKHPLDIDQQRSVIIERDRLKEQLQESYLHISREMLLSIKPEEVSHREWQRRVDNAINELRDPGP